MKLVVACNSMPTFRNRHERHEKVKVSTMASVTSIEYSAVCASRMASFHDGNLVIVTCEPSVFISSRGRRVCAFRVGE
jgi:hypothetical protein